MNFDDFIKKWRGKLCDWDNSYGGQCIDLYRFYCNEVLGFPQSPPVPGAKDIWNTYLKDYFNQTIITPDRVPNKGDIVIWNKNVGDGYGHVAIFIKETGNLFKSFDENWPKGSLCEIIEHNYTNILGWLKPKGENMSDFYKGLDLNNKESMKVAVDIWKDVADGKYVMRKEYQDLQGQFKTNDEAWKERVKEEKGRYDDFIKKLAEKLGSTQQEPDILEQITRLIQKEDKCAKDHEPRITELKSRISLLAKILEVPEEKIEETIKKIKEEGKVEVLPVGHSKLCAWLAKIGL